MGKVAKLVPQAEHVRFSGRRARAQEHEVASDVKTTDERLSGDAPMGLGLQPRRRAR